MRQGGGGGRIQRTRRTKQWRHFLAAHWRTFAAIDGFSVPVLTRAGWRSVFVFVVIHLASRRIHIAAVSMNPDSAVMTNAARSLCLDEVGFFARNGVTHLIHDGDGAFTQTGFVGVLEARGVTCVQIPRGAPNANAYAERVIQSIQRECTDRLSFFGDRGLRTALAEYVDHYHRHRNHQGIGNRIIDPGPEIGRSTGDIRERSRLGGVLRWYERADAA